MFFFYATEEEGKRQNCFVILMCRRSRTDHHHIGFLHWIILTFDPAALPHGVQLLNKATFISFSRLSATVISPTEASSGSCILQHVVAMNSLFGASFDHPHAADTLSDFPSMRKISGRVNRLGSSKC